MIVTEIGKWEVGFAGKKRQMPKSFDKTKVVFHPKKIEVLKALQKKRMTIDDLTYYIDKDIKVHVDELFNMGVIAKVMNRDEDFWRYLNTTLVPDLLKEYQTWSQSDKVDGWI